MATLEEDRLPGVDVQWASAVSTQQPTASALDEAGDAVERQLTDAPDVLFAFASSHHGPRWEQVASALSDRFPGALVIGCSAGSVIGGGEEIERRAGLSLTAARMPGVTLTPLRLMEEELPEADAPREVWERALGLSADERHDLVLLPDPFTFDPGALLYALDTHFPDAAKIGGLVSGAREPGTAALFLDGELHQHGFVGLAMSGNVAVDTVVAQGCRPVGPPMFVTRCERNCITELDGRTPVDALRELFDALEPRDQQLFEQALFIGVQMRDQVEYGPGDFLIRNVVGFHRESRALVVGCVPKQYQVVQLHVRDSRTSSEDLHAMLSRYRGEMDGHPVGALVFSCLGRGAGLYGRPNHDSEVLARHLGPIPAGGFFGNGEIGQVHGRTFVHGYTSSFGLFRPGTR